ncbi:hypothetical protein D3C76_828430 [compost metagenome]
MQGLLAHQGPLVEVRCTIEHVAAVGGAQAGRARGDAVIGQRRGAPHPPLAAAVQPRKARLRNLIEGFVQHYGIARQARRRGHAVAQVVQHVTRLAIVKHIGTGKRLLQAHRGKAPIATRCDAVRSQAETAVAWPGEVVPQHLQTVVGPGECQHAVKAFHAVAVIDQASAGSIVPGPFAHLRRYRDTAVRRVHRQAKRLGVALDQGHLPRRQLLTVLPVVLRRDDVQRLLIGVRVQRRAVDRQRHLPRLQAPAPGRNAAVAAGPAFSPHRRQVWKQRRGRDMQGQQAGVDKQNTA